MKQVSDLTFPNIRLMRDECLRNAYESPLDQCTDKEWDGVQHLMITYIRSLHKDRGYPDEEVWKNMWEHDPHIQTICQDLYASEIRMPKWAAMASWLSRTGLVMYHPPLICSIIDHALKGTLEQVK